MSVSFRCLSLLLGRSSLASGGDSPTGEAASVGMGSLTVMLSSACSKPGDSSSLILGGDSLIVSFGHPELGHL